MKFFKKYYQNLVVFYNLEVETLTSNKISTYSHKCGFKLSVDDIILLEMENFINDTVRNEHPSNVLAKVQNYFNSMSLQNNEILLNQLAINNNAVKNHVSTPETLIGKKYLPIFYSENEEQQIIGFHIDQFLTFFKNEISGLLNFISWYKKGDVNFEFPTGIDVFEKPILIDKSGCNPDMYDNEIYGFYKRIVLLYSTIASNHFGSINFRKGLLKELNFLKIGLQLLTIEMDKYHIRIANYKDYFFKEYTQHGLSCSTTECLEDVLDRPIKDFINLANLVTGYLINLSY
uniref:Abi-like protein n=1 Tax=Parastrongyloides trichosuri TaxID=131310 RepID=A0A0N4Z057_PARTI